MEEEAAGVGAGAGAERTVAGGAAWRLDWAATTGLGAVLLAISGGSSKNVYSRTRRPVAQLSSSNKSTNGSLIGRSEVSRMTACPLGLLSTAKRMTCKAGARSIPACLKESAEANCARMSASSSRLAVSSISARKGWPKDEKTAILPSPAAAASYATPDNARQEATANTEVFLLILCIA